MAPPELPPSVDALLEGLTLGLLQNPGRKGRQDEGEEARTALRRVAGLLELVSACP